MVVSKKNKCRSRVTKSKKKTRKKNTKKINKYEVFIMELIDQMTKQVMHLTILGIKNHLENVEKNNSTDDKIPETWGVHTS